jgi:hypothetical protein
MKKKMESINHPTETITAHGHQTQVMARSPVDVAPRRMARILPLTNRNFRLLWMGENVSLFGDQFYFIALPWLVFQMTGSVVAFGTILMVAGIPRAVFMLVGGVITDHSPRTVMIVSGRSTRYYDFLAHRNFTS